MSNSIESVLEKALTNHFKATDPLKQPKEKKRLNFMTVFHDATSNLPEDQHYADAKEAFNLRLLEILGKRGRKSEKVRAEQVRLLIDVVMKALGGQSVKAQNSECVTTMTKKEFDPEDKGVSVMTEDQSRLADVETGNTAAGL